MRGFAVFDKDSTGYIGVGELRYVLTNLGEKLSDQEVDELLAGVKTSSDGSIDYRAFVREVRADCRQRASGFDDSTADHGGISFASQSHSHPRSPVQSSAPCCHP